MNFTAGALMALGATAYAIAMFSVPRHKLGRGLLSRLICRLLKLGRVQTDGRQYTALWAARAAVTFTVSAAVSGNGWILVFWGVASVFPVDDVLFGDDDRWRRWWRAVRNRIKWKLPRPRPVLTPA